MKNNYDAFRKQRENTSLPEQFSWEKMGDDILQKMEKSERHVQSERKKKWRFFFWSLSILGLLSILYLWTNSNNAIKDVANQETKKQYNEPDDNNSRIKNPIQDPSSSNIEATELNKINATKKSLEENTKSTQLIQAKDKTSITASTLFKRKSLQTENPNSISSSQYSNQDSQNNSISEQLSSSLASQHKHEILSDLSSSRSNNTSPTLSVQKQTTIIQIPGIKITQVQSTQTNIPIPMHRISISTELPTPKKPSHPIPWTIAISGGVNQWLPQWKGNTSEIRTDLLKPLIGTTTQMELQKQFSSHWTISGGIQYQRLRMLFSLDTTYNEKKYEENGLLGLYLDGNDTIPYFGAGIAKYKTQRIIRHYDDTHLFNIQGLIHYSILGGKNRLKIGGGVQMHLSGYLQGRSISMDSLINHTSDQTPLQWKNHFSLVADVRYEREFSSKLHGFIYGQASRSLSNISTVSGITSKPWVYGLGLGLGYTW